VHLDINLETALEASWKEHQADPAKSLPARDVIAGMMKEGQPKQSDGNNFQNQT